MKDDIIVYIVLYWKTLVLAYGLKTTIVIVGYLIWRKYKKRIIITDVFQLWAFNEFKYRTLVALH